MKTKKNKTLRVTIIKKYFIVTFCVAMVEMNIRNLFDMYIVPRFSMEGFSEGNQPVMIIMAAVLLVNYIIGGIVFYNLTKKAIKVDNQKKIREQNLIYAAVAHDLKTPMTSVQGFAKALSDKKIAPEEQAEICDIIYRKSITVNELVNTLFEYAKFGTDEYKPDFSETDLCVLVKNIIAEYYSDFEDHNIEIRFDIPETPIIINADKKEFKRAISNLIVNSYKHNPNGIKLFVQIKEESGKIVIIIADTGNDIPGDTDIFEPFVTENSARTSGRGSGLGLAITKRIIEKHKGSIALSHSLTGYTKAFIITLK